MMELAEILGPPLLSLLLCTLIWLVKGRDPRVADTIFPHYERPKDLSVIEAGVLMDDILQTKDITYELYDLYFKGLISFEDKTVKLLKSKDSPEVAALIPTQAAILEILFPGDSGQMILDSEITKIKASKIKESIYQVLMNQGFYEELPQEARRGYYFFGYLLILFAVGFNVVSFFGQFEGSSHYKPFYLPLTLIIGLMVAGLVWGVFGALMAKKTVAGVKKRNELLGFKEFIITAEKDRIEYFLKNEPKAYKEILPFAFLFGVKEKWLAPAHDLGANFLDEDLQTITFNMDLEGFEGLFEENRNIVVGLLNIIFFALIQGAKIGLSGIGRRRRY
jgi:hypothetical protein